MELDLTKKIGWFLLNLQACLVPKAPYKLDWKLIFDYRSCILHIWPKRFATLWAWVTFALPPPPSHVVVFHIAALVSTVSIVSIGFWPSYLSHVSYINHVSYLIPHFSAHKSQIEWELRLPLRLGMALWPVRRWMVSNARRIISSGSGRLALGGERWAFSIGRWTVRGKLRAVSLVIAWQAAIQQIAKHPRLWQSLIFGALSQ